MWGGGGGLEHRERSLCGHTGLIAKKRRGRRERPTVCQPMLQTLQFLLHIVHQGPGKVEGGPVV